MDKGPIIWFRVLFEVYRTAEHPLVRRARQANGERAEGGGGAQADPMALLPSPTLPPPSPVPAMPAVLKPRLTALVAEPLQGYYHEVRYCTPQPACVLALR